MPELLQITDFSGLFAADTPLMDTRAPIEFEQGAFPNTQNLILMNDEEREKIGKCYKKQGQQAAIKLGHQLVQGTNKQVRLDAWLKFIQKHPNGALYCFRGGMRSQITQQWIFDEFGIEYPRIKGGYKALRRFLLDETDRIMANITPLVIGGKTGCGKTLLLDKIENKIDLEGLANHRGSAFGNTTTAQPTQINFENSLAIELIKKQTQIPLIFEDEGSNVGTVHIPDCVQAQTKQADLILLEASVEERLKVSMDAYVLNMQRDFIVQDVQNGFDNFSHYWLKSLEKIKKRLGLERYKVMLKALNSALIQYKEQDDASGFYPIIESLLLDYYDPMYDYQIQKKADRVVFKGNMNAVLDYLKTA
ncbi:Selenophosphate-dependent tRNA 2-selenouridine synthase [uncultured Candidatus Thioglobus sp.]|nr:Selenophosphate-dependent tRNA 2-selenouridine synthase [uncultured Candidatus Thioglobus sp.]